LNVSFHANRTVQLESGIPSGGWRLDSDDLLLSLAMPHAPLDKVGEQGQAGQDREDSQRNYDGSFD
jgi:hypothetical protein